MFRSRLVLSLMLLCAASLALPGCAAVIAVAGVKAGTTVAQDRTVGRAIDDATMNTQLNVELADESFDLYRHVNTKVVNGVILLTGRVPSEEARADAGRIAWGVSGVRNVANELDIQSNIPLTDFVNDVRISNQLRAKVLADRGISWVNYNVTTVNGNIYLLGLARDQNELERVTLHARTIPGVKKVASYVEIKPAAPNPQAQANLY